MQVNVLLNRHIALDASPEPSRAKVFGTLNGLLEILAPHRNGGLGADAIKEIIGPDGGCRGGFSRPRCCNQRSQQEEWQAPECANGVMGGYALLRFLSEFYNDSLVLMDYLTTAGNMDHPQDC
ncbi:MAG: hypothetical protein JO316_26855 [Abitibacteriaceae bacterium]|nr:hypothetical protein [Abditibacteriaceae bacterium]